MKHLLVFFLLITAPVAHAADWSGFYTGLSASQASATLEADTQRTKFPAQSLGLTAGYNTQFGQLVLGAETDFQYSTARKSEYLSPATLDHNLPWFGTARARIGYAFDNLLLYGTVGAAVINYKTTLTAPGFSMSDELTRYGLAVGGGVEYAINTHWSAKVEYLYLDTGKQNVTVLTVPLDARASENVVRLGLNYRF